MYSLFSRYYTLPFTSLLSVRFFVFKDTPRVHLFDQNYTKIVILLWNIIKCLNVTPWAKANSLSASTTAGKTSHRLNSWKSGERWLGAGTVREIFWQILEKGYKQNKRVQLTGPMDGLLPSPDSTHTYHKVIKNRRNRKWDQDGARDSIKAGFFAPWPVSRFNIFWPLPQLLYP